MLFRSVGFFKDRGQIAALDRKGDAFTPAMPEEQRASLLRGWRRAVAAAQANTEEKE